ncbi:DUF3789 domain-containing protein [Liquorilactobacillus mali]|nr:DUF3789 domain-containing protein [Liquorilactobacillus mali]
MSFLIGVIIGAFIGILMMCIVKAGDKK